MSRKIVFACVLTMILAAGAAMADPGRGANVLCYVWANDPTHAIGSPYTPSTVYSYNAVGRSNANTVTHIGTGQYSVTCKGVGGGALFAGSGSWGPGGHVQVTGYGGEDADYCKVSSW